MCDDMEMASSSFSADDFKLLAATRLSLSNGRLSVHAAICDACNNIILGRRFKCVCCDDVDFCETCEKDIGLARSESSSEWGSSDEEGGLAENLEYHQLFHPLYVLSRPVASSLRPLVPCRPDLLSDTSECAAVAPEGNPVLCCDGCLTPIDRGAPRCDAMVDQPIPVRAVTCVHCDGLWCPACASETATPARPCACLPDDHVLIVWRSAPPGDRRSWPRSERFLATPTATPLATPTGQPAVRGGDRGAATRRKGSVPPACVRTMTKADVSGVMEVEVSSFASPYEPEAFVSLIERRPDKAAGFVVDSDGPASVDVGAIAGYIMVDWRVRQRTAHVVSIAVLPEARGRGVARALLQRMLDEAKRLGLSKATLHVAVWNDAAISLYRSCGFSEKSMAARYYRDEPEGQQDAWFMASDIE